MEKILLIILVISLSLTCLTIAVEQHAFDIMNYIEAFDKHNLEDITGKNMQEYTDIVLDLFNYLKLKSSDDVLEPYFNEREILHMKDVQVLFYYGFIIKYLSIILSIAIIIYFVLKGERVLLGKWIFRGMIINWAFLLILSLMIYFNFNKYFTLFHHIFFSNDLWLLDPETDLLIQMLPEEFFSSIATKIGLSFFGYLVTIQGVGYAATQKRRKKGEKTFEKIKGRI